MNCVNHAEVQSAAFCIRCGHALCTECTRNVRGSVYCESCLADMVSGAGTSEKSAGAAPPQQQKKALVYGSNPGIAFALGLIPGVGAIYNGDFMKAAIHILIFGVLVQLQNQVRFGGGALLGLATAAFYFYMAFEAYFTAKKRKLAAEGVELETPIDRLHQQFGDMQNKELWGGVALIVVGGLFLADNFNIVQFDRIGQLWPLVLVGLGIWMLKRYQEKGV
jgi:TM2 domain-containing membrane protein YozV